MLEKKNKEKQEEEIESKSWKQRETALREKEEEGARLRKEVENSLPGLRWKSMRPLATRLNQRSRSLSKKEFC